MAYKFIFVDHVNFYGLLKIYKLIMHKSIKTLCTLLALKVYGKN